MATGRSGAAVDQALSRTGLLSTSLSLSLPIHLSVYSPEIAPRSSVAACEVCQVTGLCRDSDIVDEVRVNRTGVFKRRTTHSNAF